MTWWLIFNLLFLYNVLADEEKEKTRTVILEDGAVAGTKYWDGDFYEFLSIPYAEAPTGRDRYQAPLPVKKWKGVLSADVRNIVCHQSYFTDAEDKDGEFIVSGEDDCLVINLFVPEIASEDNLVPVVVYIHSGAYAGGNGNSARFHYLARHDIIVISFNYRLGALGFACLGNREIPGNAALKDQRAALRWIKKNVKKFGGDPDKITLAGYSVGASMAEILSLSKTTKGLFDQLILDSASALSPFAINRDPVGTAKNLARAMGYNGTLSLEGLTEFYLNVSVEVLAARSLNFFLPNSTFGFAPCIENFHKGIEPILVDSPMDILRKGTFPKIPVLVGFAHMEGISRTIKFGEWREEMTKDFTKFIPADLIFDDDKTKKAVSATIKKRYFKDDEVNIEKLQNYIDYFSDAMFKYAIMKSLRMRAALTNRKIYLYEFNYVGKLSMQHNYMDKIKGASHRDQTAYILDFYGWTNSYKDLDMRDRMTTMWSDFIQYGNPTAYESAVVNYNWIPYTNENQNYLQITRKPIMKKNLFVDGYNYWEKIYKKYYWNPVAPEQPKPKKAKQVEQNTVSTEKTKDETKAEKKKEEKSTDDVKTGDNNIKPNDVEENKTFEDIKESTKKDEKIVGEIRKPESKSKANNEQELEKEKNSKIKNPETNKENKKEDKVKVSATKEKSIVKEVKDKENKKEIHQESLNKEKPVKENKKASNKNNQDTIKLVNEIKIEPKDNKGATQKPQEKK